MAITLHQQIASAAREAAMRKNFYRRQVAAMHAIVATLKLVGEALEWNREDFDADLPVIGSDLADWFGGWRRRLHDIAPLQDQS